MLDLHRHSEYSTFDGFGKTSELAKQAKGLGYTSLGISDHGTTSGLVQHYKACKVEEIKPILGVEGYFQPTFNKNKQRYHLCLFAKDLKGYENINRMMFIGESQKYYNPIITLKELEEYSQGVICTSACIAGYISQAIVKNNKKMADKMIKQFKEIFGEDFYIEIQPYKISDAGVQEKVNVELMKLAKRNNIKCILTSDSHYGSKEDFATYMKMHEIAKHNSMDIEGTYGERYMPSEKEIVQRFADMHEQDFGKATKKLAYKMLDNLQEIEDKVDGEILDELPMKLPELVEGENGYKILIKDVKRGLKKRGKYIKKYINRCKKELEVISYHGYEEYFLIVADYVNWAKEQGIAVGPGRGSVCNCQVAWALGITDVDSLKFKLDFNRFMRKDKAKMPDIDLDFPTNRRGEVIEYLVNKYKGHAAQICNYGLYKVDNLINDLVKVSGMEDKGDIKKLKDFVNKFVDDGSLDYKRMMKTYEAKMYNKLHDNILVHFSKLYKKVRFIGTHAAGVAITGGNLLDYTSLRISKDGKIFTNYDLADLEDINIIKFDILGLKTMESINELRELTGVDSFDDKYLEDEKILEAFGKGDTDGIFQFEKRTAKDILQSIQANCFEDVVAASSMNRPGPLSLNMPQQYAENKFNIDDSVKDTLYYKYTQESYGTIIYQEQILQICVNIGGFEWGEADKVLKMEKGATGSATKMYEENYDTLSKKFIKNGIKNGLSEEEASELFEATMVYSFNKGHSTGYSIISFEEMYYKVYHTTIYWFSKLKHASKDGDVFKFTINAVKNGIVIFLPHVNYSSECTIREVDGEEVIQQGLNMIKGIGNKAAKYIYNERQTNGHFKSYDDFVERCRSRAVHKGVINKLLESGALEFDKKTYLGRVVKYNSAMLARS